MVPRAFLVLALLTALGGVPSSAAAATGAAPADPSNAALIALAVGAAAITLAGIMLLVMRRRRGSASDTAERQRASKATDQVVDAALTRRMVSRGRLRLDDDVMAGSPPAPSPESTERASRSSG